MNEGLDNLWLDAGKIQVVSLLDLAIRLGVCD
jgi:hypothetical protein